MNEPVAAEDLEYNLPFATKLRYAAATNAAIVVYTICTVSCLIWLVYRRKQRRLLLTAETNLSTPIGKTDRDVKRTMRRIIGIPAITTIICSTIAFLVAITQTRRYANGEWSGYPYKQYEWPPKILEYPQVWIVDPFYTNSIIAIICVLGLGAVAEWLHRNFGKRRAFTYCLIATIFTLWLLTFGRRASSGVVCGVPFEWMYWNKYYKTWSHPFWSAGIADVMVGFFLSGVVVWMAEQCIKKKIRWPALGAMSAAIYAAYGLVSMGQGGGYEGWNGIPFTWYRWTDIGDGYKMYSALYADIALAIVSVGVLVLLAEWHHRLENKAVSASILIVVAGLSAILLLWRTSIHYSGIIAPIEFLGTPFHWVSPNDYGPWYQVGLRPAFAGNVAVAFTCVTLLGFVVHSAVRGVTRIKLRYA